MNSFKKFSKSLLLLVIMLALAVSFMLISCGHKHTESVVSGVPATCTKDGYTDKVICSTCDEIISDSEVILATGHTEVIVPEISATCTKDGATEGKKCSTCGCFTVEPELIPSAHTKKKIPAISPTCTTDGATEGLFCERCDYIFTEPTIIPAKHTEEIIPRIEPSIGISGLSEGKKCSTCGDILVAPYEISLLSMELDSSSVKGVISGKLTFNQLSGEFSLYYADSNKKRLDYYNSLSSFTSSDSSNTLSFENIIVPKNCSYIIADGEGDYDYFVKIPESSLRSQVDYTFSALSDVHYNKGDYFNGALDFLDDYGVDFVGVSGDLTNNGEVSYLEKFNEAIKNRLYKVYATTGNHDENAVISGNWEKYINTSVTADEEIVNISKNGIDFVFVPKKAENNVFVFLCQTSWSYPKNPTGTEYSLITEEQIKWLTDVLEEYKSKNVFLFFHTFLSAPDGTQESAVGNLRNPGGYAYDLPFSYGAADEVAFRALMKEYKNVVYFSGHSHWMFEMEIYNENLNYSNFDNEYCHMVHVPSVCEPRWIGENDTRRTSKTGVASEGWIIEVYDEAIILIPVDFITEVFYTEYMKIIPLEN